MLRARRAPYYRVTSEPELLAAAYRAAPRAFRWLGLSLRRARFQALAGRSRGIIGRTCEELERGAKVWPFVFNENSLALRKGYVLVRAGAARAAILTEVS